MLRHKAFVTEVKDVDERNRSFLAVASTEDVDRDNDTIKAAGWKLDEYKKNPIVAWSHDYYSPPIGKSLETWVDGKRLMFRPQFATAEENPKADSIFRLYKGGYLKAFSVGFRGLRWETVSRDNGKVGVDFLEQELFEVSAVAVPSNPNALVAAKGAGIISERELLDLATIAHMREALARSALVGSLLRKAIRKRQDDRLGIVDPSELKWEKRDRRFYQRNDAW